jgi:hypothetical protein
VYEDSGGGKNILICVDSNQANGGGTPSQEFPNGQEITCNGEWITISVNEGTYKTPEYAFKPDGSSAYNGGDIINYPMNYYRKKILPKNCRFNFFKTNDIAKIWESGETTWAPDPNCDKIINNSVSVPVPDVENNNLFINYVGNP